MPGLVLSDREQRVLRTLLAAEPVPGSPIPEPSFLEATAELIPCEMFGAVVARNDGPTIASTQVPRGYVDRFFDAGPDESGPLFLGLVHWSRNPIQAAACQGILPGHVDGICLGFRNGPDAVAQIYFDRRARLFDDRDRAMLHLLQPVLRRHLRQRPTPSLPVSLTVQERRVLMEVSVGESNAQIAETLCIAQATVRKHLENVFRKLGVTNRLAAVVALEGRLAPGPDRRERLATYA